MSSERTYQVELRDIATITQTEEHIPWRVDDVARSIEICGIWTHPILVEKTLGAVMDGHHRFNAAKRLGLTQVPVIHLSYDDPNVSLQAWDPATQITPQDIADLIACGRVLPRKTTRHIIRTTLPKCHVPLEHLTSNATTSPLPEPGTAPTIEQILAEDYVRLMKQAGITPLSAVDLDRTTDRSFIPHQQLRQSILADPALAALAYALPCSIGLGDDDDFPFRIVNTEMLLVSPVFLSDPAGLAAVVRWGVEAVFAIQEGGVDRAQIDGLLTYGARLVETSGSALLWHLMGTERLAALKAYPQGTDARDLEQWIKSTLPPQVIATDGHDDGAHHLAFTRPIEDLLVSNADTRLIRARGTGKNKYGTVAHPRPNAVHFSSSTASSISNHGFLYADVMRRDIYRALRGGRPVAQLRSALSSAFVGEMARYLGIEGPASGAIAASGTDTEMLAITMALAHGDKPVTNILISSTESGRGVKFAGLGQYFDTLTSTGHHPAKGDKVWNGADIDLIDVELRTKTGDIRPLDEVDHEVVSHIADARAAGRHILLHQLSGSKTGLVGPSLDLITRYIGDPDIDVVVDACQMRSPAAELRQLFERGAMLQLSGSKFLTGPPFSGMLMVPPRFAQRRPAFAQRLTPHIGYASDWSDDWAEALPADEGALPFGAHFRWLPALLEAILFDALPQRIKTAAFDRFRDEVAQRLQGRPYFKIISTQSGPREFIQSQSIASFQVFGTTAQGTREALPEAQCRRLFEWLNEDAADLLPNLLPHERAVMSQEFHIGQPVALQIDGQDSAILRLVIGARFFSTIGYAPTAVIATALESEISDMKRAVTKLEIMLRHWWILKDV